jgi:ATP-dependent DNA ligase
MTPTTAIPKITPLVVKPRTAAFDNADWLFDLKYDGFRALLEIDANGARLLSRTATALSISTGSRRRWPSGSR